MSTRGVYTFKDERNTIHVYKHSDNYPTEAVKAIKAALPFCWFVSDPGRFEADEFAAAFVTGNKRYHFRQLHEQLTEEALKNDSWEHVTMNLEVSIPPKYYITGGQVYLMKSGPVKKVSQADIEFRYEITQDKKTMGLIVKCWDTDYWDDPRRETLIYNGTLEGMSAWAKEFEADKNAA